MTAKLYLPASLVGCFSTAFTYGAMRLPRSIEPGSCLEGRGPVAWVWEVGEFVMAHGLVSP